MFGYAAVMGALNGRWSVFTLNNPDIEVGTVLGSDVVVGALFVLLFLKLLYISKEKQNNYDGKMGEIML